MTSSHSHGGASLEPAAPQTVKILALIVGAIATTIAVVALWPDGTQVSRGQNPYTGKGVSIVPATVLTVAPSTAAAAAKGPTGCPR